MQEQIIIPKTLSEIQNIILIEQILKQLSDLHMCSNFILTDQQYTDAIKSGISVIPCTQEIIKKQFIYQKIDMREHIIDKLTKYKIVSLKIERFGKFYVQNKIDNFISIMYINSFGEIYGITSKEYDHNNYIYYDKSITPLYSKNWCYDLFNKPFENKEEINKSYIFPYNTLNDILNGNMLIYHNNNKNIYHFGDFITNFNGHT